MIQRGRNSKYPSKIEVWREGDLVPEWLSDRARVESVDLGSGEKILKINKLSSGGIEIISSDWTNTLIKTSGEGDYVCFGDNRIFSLSEIQLNLLYKNDVEK